MGAKIQKLADIPTISLRKMSIDPKYPFVSVSPFDHKEHCCKLTEHHTVPGTVLLPKEQIDLHILVSRWFFQSLRLVKAAKPSGKRPEVERTDNEVRRKRAE